MIILGMTLFLFGMMSGCKKKNEEEKVGGLLEQLSKAGNKNEERKIEKKIEKLTERQRKREKENVREVEVKIDKPKTEKVRLAVTKTNLRILAEAVRLFKKDTGRYPTEDEELAVLSKKPAGVKNYKQGGYLKNKKVLKDGWEREFIYVRFSENGGNPAIKSFGADGTEYGEDYDADLCSYFPSSEYDSGMIKSEPAANPKNQQRQKRKNRSLK